MKKQQKIGLLSTLVILALGSFGVPQNVWAGGTVPLDGITSIQGDSGILVTKQDISDESTSDPTYAIVIKNTRAITGSGWAEVTQDNETGDYTISVMRYFAASGPVKVAYDEDTKTYTYSVKTSSVKSNSDEYLVTTKGVYSYLQATTLGLAGGTAYGTNTLAIGSGAKSYNESTIAIGASSKASQWGDIAIGESSIGNGMGATAVGQYAKAQAASATAIGNYANAKKGYAVAIGYATAEEKNAIAVGASAKASIADSIAMGLSAKTTGESAIAFGSSASASGAKSFATGYWAKATEEGANVLGGYGTASAVNALALGQWANSSATDAVAIGAESTATTGIETIADGTKIATVSFGHKAGDFSGWYVKDDGSTKTYSSVSGTGYEEYNYETDKLSRLTNIAYGITNTDAATYGQLIKAVDGGYKVASTNANTAQSVELEYNDADSTMTKVKITVEGNGEVAKDDKRLVNGGTVYDAIAKAVGSAYSDSDTISINDDREISVKNMAMSTVGATDGATATGNYAFAVGGKASATGRYSIALGYDAIAAENTEATTDPGSTGSSIAIGTNTRATGNGTVVIGAVAKASGEEGIAIGSEAKSEGYEGIALGSAASVGSTAIGAMALGAKSFAFGEGASAIGYQSMAYGSNSIAMGVQAKTGLLSSNDQGEVQYLGGGHNSIAIGNYSMDFGNYSVAIGYGAAAGGFSDVGSFINGATAVGFGAGALQEGATALGAGSFARGKASVAAGLNSFTNAEYSNAFGYMAHAQGKNSTAIGYQALASTDIAEEGDNKVATVSFGHKKDETYYTLTTTGEMESHTYTDTVLSRLTNVAYGKDNHDAAAYGQLIAAGEYSATSGEDASQAQTATLEYNDANSNATKVKIKIAAEGKVEDNDKRLVDGDTVYDAIAKAVSDSAYSGSDTITISNKKISVTNMAMGASGSTGATATGAASFAIGDKSKATGTWSVALGDGAEAGGTAPKRAGEDSGATVAIGAAAKAYGNYSTALGYLAETTATGYKGVAIGMQTKVSGDSAIGIGAHTEVGGEETVAIGYDVTTSQTVDGATTAAGGATGIGSRSEASAQFASALGYQSAASGVAAVAVGTASVAQGISSIAMGYSTQANDNGAVAIGSLSQAYANSSTALGLASHALGTASAALGAGSWTYQNAQYGAAFGTYAEAQAEKSVAIGYQAVAKTANTVSFGHAKGDSYIGVNEQGAYESMEYGTDSFATLTNVKPGQNKNEAATWDQLVKNDQTYELKVGEETEIKNNAEGTAFKLKLNLKDGIIDSGDDGSGYVTGKKLYTELRNVTSTNYIAAGNTTAANLSLLDSNLKTVSDKVTTLETNVNKIQTTIGNVKLNTQSLTFDFTGKTTDKQTISYTDGNGAAKTFDITISGISGGGSSTEYSAGNGIAISDDNNKKKISVKLAENGGLTVDEKGLAVQKDGKVESENTGIVTGGTVYDAILKKTGDTTKLSAAGLGDNLTDSVLTVNDKIGGLSDDINKVGAGAAALAALHPEGYDPTDKWSFAVGYGHYKNANAGAIGAFFKPNADTTLSLGGTIGNGDTMMNAGVSFKLGSRSGKSVYRTEAAVSQELASLRKNNEKLTAQNASQQKEISALRADNERMQKQIEMILSQMKMSNQVAKTAK